MYTQVNRLISLLMIASAGLLAAEGSIVASLGTTKGAYLQGEPIELRLTVTNGTNETMGIVAEYPFFGGIKLGPEANSTAASRAPISDGLMLGGGKFPIINADAGTAFGFSVYLQRYMEDLAPGTYDLPYSIAIRCVLRDTTRQVAATGHGVVRVTVLYSGEGDLASVLAGHVGELRSTNYWVQRSADEALYVTNSHLVIPYLRELVVLESSNSAVLALAKFRGNSDATKLVLGTAQVGTAAQAISAISVLEQWNYTLTESDFQTLLSRDNVWLKLAALRYAGKVGGTSYIPAIAAYTEDGDELVVKEARRVKGMLVRKQ